MKRTLVIVDVQKDFYSPDGSQSVPSAAGLPEKIARVTDSFDSIVVTMDWHPADHCSFKANGGIWPPHCVQNTQGAGLADCIAAHLSREGVYYYRKGTDSRKEQYGAFEDLTPDDPLYAVFGQSDAIDVCGIAGDYCVKETLSRLISLGFKDKLTVLMGLTASIDDGSALKAFVEENNINYEQ